MACATSSYEELWLQPHSFATAGGVAGLAVGMVLSFYLRPRPGADPRGQASGKMIMIACGAAGAFIGALAKMAWERFC